MLRRVGWLIVLPVGILFLAGSASAGLEVFGGVTYNTYSLDWSELLPDLPHLHFESGTGTYAGARYWVTDRLAIGGWIDSFSGSSRDGGDDPSQAATIEGAGTGYLGSVMLDLPAGRGLALKPFVAAGVYDLSARARVRISPDNPNLDPVTLTGRLEAEEQAGGQAGLEVGMQLLPDLRLNGSIAYRHIPEFSRGTFELAGVGVERDDLKGLDASGLSAGLGLTYSF